MAETRNIVFDDGIREYTINNDPKRVLKVNMKDVGLIDRIEKSVTRMQKEVAGIKDIQLNEDGTAELASLAEPIRQVNNLMRKEFDSLFYPGAANIVFGKQNPLSTLDGVSLFERFMKSFLDMVGPEMQKEDAATLKKMNNYKKQYDKFTQPTKVVNGR